MNVIDPGPSTTKPKTARVRLLNLATAGFLVAWLVVACYALAYLLTH